MVLFLVFATFLGRKHKCSRKNISSDCSNGDFDCLYSCTNWATVANAADTSKIPVSVSRGLSKCLSNGGVVYQSQLDKLKNLTCTNRGLNTLSPFRSSKNLTTLKVSHNKLSSLFGVEKMEWLAHVDVSYNKLMNADSLYRSAYLVDVNASNNQLKSTKFLNSSIASNNLEKVYLSNNLITNISSLSSIPYVSAKGQNFSKYATVSAHKGAKVKLPFVGFDGKKIVVTAPKKAGSKVVTWKSSPDKNHVFAGTVTLKVK